MVLWIIAALVSAFIKGLCGVGDAPVFSSILAFRYDNIQISPVSVMMSLPANILLAVKNRKALRRSLWLPLTVLIISGNVPGILLLKNTDTRVLKVWFGFFIILVGILMLLNELSPKKRRPSRILLVLIGVLAGVTSGLFGIGVLLIIYVTQTTDNLEEFKANICMVYAAENATRLLLYIILGVFTMAHLKRALMVFPFILIGIFLGMKSAAYLDERRAKIVIMCMLIFSGVTIVLSNL
ncbi:MAG: sulfite exporter TauE/SafE family protein [Flexilinea sp.]|nr:sulfite exporter TauE/SafE family protein [Flexilinea sp.]